MILPKSGRCVITALPCVKRANPRLKIILDKRLGRAQFEPGKLGELISLTSTIGFSGSVHQTKNLQGEVVEYFLCQIASAEGKKGGPFPPQPRWCGSGSTGLASR